MTETTAKADYIAARASESLSYGDIAYAQSQGWCPSSLDGMGPHRPDDTTDPVTCAECGALVEEGDRGMTATLVSWYDVDSQQVVEWIVDCTPEQAGALDARLKADADALGPRQDPYVGALSDPVPFERFMEQAGLNESEDEG